jgi:hypothetical protein
MDDAVHEPSATPMDELDDETRDELMYDSMATSRLMDFIFSRTKDRAPFQTLYSVAAGAMMSMDLEIGLCVLCSYDYLAEFHACLVDFFRDEERWNESADSYVRVLAKVSPKERAIRNI